MNWGKQSTSLQGIAGYDWTFNFLIHNDGSHSMQGMVVTRDYMRLMGIRSVAGRGFADTDFQQAQMLGIQGRLDGSRRRGLWHWDGSRRGSLRYRSGRRDLRHRGRSGGGRSRSGGRGHVRLFLDGGPELGLHGGRGGGRSPVMPLRHGLRALDPC